MGGKLSSEGEPSQEMRDGSMRSHASRPETSNGTRSDLSYHQGLRFEPSVFSDTMNASVFDQRIMRANSVGMNGMAIPQASGLRFYYNRTMLNSESNASEGRRSSASRSQYVVSQSLPPYLYSSLLIKDSQCPMCKKVIPADDVEIHFVMCVTKPRVTYNEDIMTSDSGEECAICLDELKEGENIARLPCLCIYHKACIDEWFVRSQTCPEHPPD